MQALRFERSDKSRLALFLVNRGMFKCLCKYVITNPSVAFGHSEVFYHQVLLKMLIFIIADAIKRLFISDEIKRLFLMQD